MNLDACGRVCDTSVGCSSKEGKVATVVCKECGFSVTTTGRGQKEYNVRASHEEFIRMCKALETMQIEERIGLSVAEKMTKCPYFSKSITAALLPSAL